MVEGSDLFKGSTKRLIKYSGKSSNLVCFSSSPSFHLPAGRSSPCSPPAHLSGWAAQWACMLGSVLVAYIRTVTPLWCHLHYIHLYSIDCSPATWTTVSLLRVPAPYVGSLRVPPPSKPLHPSPSPSSSGLSGALGANLSHLSLPPPPRSTPWECR